VTGALLSLDFAPIVGTTGILVMDAGQQTLKLEARVVRVNEVSARSKQEGAPPEWTAGIAFVDVSPSTQRAIARFYSRLLEASRKRLT
jgi:hypothetical protein